MGYAGIYTRNEVVQLNAAFVNLDGSAATVTSPTVELYQVGAQILAPTAMVQRGTSNKYYYDYTVPDAPTEGDVFAIYKGQIDGVNVEGADYFKIDLLKDHVLENRLGSQRILFYEATTTDAVRHVIPGKLDRQVIQTKYDSDVDWSTPRSSKTLWFWYDDDASINPVKVGEAAP